MKIIWVDYDIHRKGVSTCRKERETMDISCLQKGQLIGYNVHQLWLFTMVMEGKIYMKNYVGGKIHTSITDC